MTRDSNDAPAATVDSIRRRGVDWRCSSDAAVAWAIGAFLPSGILSASPSSLRFPHAATPAGVACGTAGTRLSVSTDGPPAPPVILLPMAEPSSDLPSAPVGAKKSVAIPGVARRQILPAAREKGHAPRAEGALAPPSARGAWKSVATARRATGAHPRSASGPCNHIISGAQAPATVCLGSLPVGGVRRETNTRDSSAPAHQTRGARTRRTASVLSLHSSWLKSLLGQKYRIAVFI